MSEKEFSKDESIPHVPEEHGEEQSPANDQGNPEEQEGPVESEPQNDDHESPTVEGAVGGDVEDDELSCLDKKLISPGKEDIFRRFFSREYDQAKAPILGRHRHKAERQRRRHSSDGCTARLVGSDPEQLPRYRETPRVVLNQAGAIIGRTVVPAAAEPEQLGSENGPAPSDLQQVGGGSDHSIGSVETAPIEDVYAADYPCRWLCNTSRLLPHSEPIRTDIQLLAYDGDEQTSPTPGDGESSPQENPPRRRQRRNAVTEPLSASELEIVNEFKMNEFEETESTDVPLFSICLERKISSDSSGDSLNLGEEAKTYRSPAEEDSSHPVPDLAQETVEELTKSWEALRISEGIVYESKPDVVEQGSPVSGCSPDETENKPDVVERGSPVSGCSPDDETENKPVVEQNAASEQSPRDAEAENKPDVVEQSDEQETVSEQSPVLGCSLDAEAEQSM